MPNALYHWLEQFYRPHVPTLPADAPVWVSLSSNGTWGEALDAQCTADICERHLGTSKVHALRHTWARAMEDVGAKVSDIAALRAADNLHAGALADLFGFTEEPPLP